MQTSDLSVQGQTLQSLYNLYANNLLIVNRRYQRKLVWGIDEKSKLVDSVVKSLPIPLILLAERRRGMSGKYEIIDGLQRLDAVFSFMENGYPLHGEFFDLDTIGDTKARLDAGVITEQRTPKMSRESSLLIANYQLPVSIYRDASPASVDEVFRRINSGGRRLSLHEIRQAGAVGPLPDLIRKVAAAIRRDGTFSDSVPLNDMAALSISRKDLNYGVGIEDLFWARHHILGQEEIRSSSDEELVLDLVLDCIVKPCPTTGWQNRDGAYGLERNIRTESLDQLNQLVLKSNPDILLRHIIAIVELIDATMGGHGSLGQHMVSLETYERGTRRQFQAVFNALYSLTYDEGLLPRSDDALRSILHHFWSKGVSIPTGGSAWGRDMKAKTYEQVTKLLRKAFYKPEPHPSIARLNSRRYIEGLLRGPIAEDSFVEIKQGFCHLSDTPKENKGLLSELLKTSAAMVNMGPQSEGIILIGVADSPEDAQRVHSLFGGVPVEVCGKCIVDTERQLSHLGYDVDRWWRRWKDSILSADAPSEFKNHLAASLTPVYCDEQLLWELRPKSYGRPVALEGKFYTRIGPATHELDGNAFITTVMPRFA